MYKQFYILFFLLLYSFPLLSQIKVTPEELADSTFKKGGYIVPGKIIDGDTIMHVYIKEVIVLPPYKFKSRRHKRRYTRLVRYVKKVYPYSKIIQKKIFEINKHIIDFETKREKKRYVKSKERELKKEFEGQLRKLTYTQGRILIKLVDRETGTTTYEVVKGFKGSLTAFFWQSIALMFGSNLKAEYDPNGDDAMIEDIIIRIENGEL